MAERFPGREPERRPIEHEVLDLNNGPIDIALSNHELRIVAPERDLGESWNVDYLVIDPNDYHPELDKGFKGLRDGEEIILGRGYNHGRFDFSPFVSARHVMLSRDGSRVAIRDLDSTNGTYQLIRREERKATPKDFTHQVGVAKPEFSPSAFKLAGYSVPSDRHPERNEDAYFVDQVSRSMGVFDGVGGIRGSERASKLASQAVLEHLKKVQSDVPRSLGQMAMYEALWSGHKAILSDGPPSGIATTATVAKVFETEGGNPFVVVASVGDSRAYLFRDGHLAHLTLDQAYRLPGHGDEDAKRLQETLANATDLSELDEEAQAAFRRRNIITSYLGREGEPPVIVVSGFEAFEGDKLVVTSDGIHDNLTNDEIESIVRTPGATDMVVKTLVNAARNRSRDEAHFRAKSDDMTAAILAI